MDFLDKKKANLECLTLSSLHTGLLDDASQMGSDWPLDAAPVKKKPDKDINQTGKLKSLSKPRPSLYSFLILTLGAD